MDLVSKSSTIHGSQSLAPLLSPGGSLFRPHQQQSYSNSFPIIAIAVIGIVATAFLLVSYYVFVIKCCLNWHRIDLLRRFSLSRNRQREEALMAYSPARQSRGLDESVIRAIPIFRFEKKAKVRDLGERSFCECAVCLSEFQEEEKLKRIPNCRHVFHIDCIDVWLQNSANCPLCRTSISSNTRFPADQIIAPSASPQDPNQIVGGDEDFVVIELGNPQPSNQALLGRQERLNSGEVPPPAAQRSISPSPRKLESRMVHKKGRKFQKVTSMGDECIDIRDKDDQFAVQPIRRSFSMDSSADQRLYLAVQEALRQNSQVNEVSLSVMEGCSSRVKRSFFSFGHSRGSRSSILPVHLEP